MISVELFKYSFDNKTHLDASEDLVRFPIYKSGNMKHNGRSGSYVTPYRTLRNYSSQYKLSITYSPNFRYELDVNDLLSKDIRFLNNNQSDLGNYSDLKEDKLERVWPAFGYYGGAREIFVAFNRGFHLNIGQSWYKFNVPGRMDFYHSDDDEEVKDKLVLNFVQNLYSLLGDEATGNEYISAKIKPSVGMAFNIPHYHKFDFNLTASIAYRELCTDSYVKCWLNAWKDDESNKCRYIYNIQEGEYLFKRQCLRSLVHISDFTLNVFKPLFSALNNILHFNNCLENSLFCVRLP